VKNAAADEAVFAPSLAPPNQTPVAAVLAWQRSRQGCSTHVTPAAKTCLHTKPACSQAKPVSLACVCATGSSSIAGFSFLGNRISACTYLHASLLLQPIPSLGLPSTTQPDHSPRPRGWIAKRQTLSGLDCMVLAVIDLWLLPPSLALPKPDTGRCRACMLVAYLSVKEFCAHLCSSMGQLHSSPTSTCLQVRPPDTS